MRTLKSFSYLIQVAAFALLALACGTSQSANEPVQEPTGDTTKSTPADDTSADPVEKAGDKAAGPAQGEPCPEAACAEGLTCVEYYGIAGARGPKFTSCEIPCATPGTECPAGQACITIADGPGQVCRPREQ